MSIETVDKTKVREAATIDAHIQSALRDLRFGSVEIVVHEGKVVQIHRTEKIRVEADR